MSLAELRATGADRGVTPHNFELAGIALTNPIRATPDHRLDLLDVVENVCSTRDAGQKALSKLVSDVDGMTPCESVIGFPTSVFTKVRWAGSRGSHRGAVR